MLLTTRMEEMNIPKEECWWYLELLEEFGATHAGFGLGFERRFSSSLVWAISRDVISLPETPGMQEF